MTRRTHAIVCGFSRSGTTLLYNMLRASAEDADCPPHEASALAFPAPARDLVTKRPLDVFRLKQIVDQLSGRDIKVIFVVRDCRSLLNSFHSRVPGQEVQGFDQCFLIAPDWCSYSNPGLLETHAAITAFLEERPGLCTVVRFEDLVRDPETVRARLEAFTGIRLAGTFSAFHEAEIPDKLAVQLNGVRPVDAARATSWRSPRGLERVARQFALSPQLHDLLRHWGYEADQRWMELALQDAEPSVPAGTVVTVARSGGAQEAADLVASCRRHGLSVHVAQAGPDDASRVDALAEARRAARGPLLVTPAGARIERDPWPYLAQYAGDLAVFTTSAGELRPEVLWLNDTAGARAFLLEWGSLRRASGERSDGQIIDSLRARYRASGGEEVLVQHLPPSMCGNPEGAMWAGLPGPPFVVLPPGG